MPRKNIPTDVFKSINMMDGDKEQCWPWTGKVNKKDGRPYITIEGKRRPAYCVVLELYSGKLQHKQVARHACDNKLCCNPQHLRFGTHQNNMDDMKERERHGLSKITVRAIRRLLDKGRSHKGISELYGVSREAITAIATGRTHRNGDTEQGSDHIEVGNDEPLQS